MFEICSELTIKTPELRRRRSGVFIVNFEHISHHFIVFLLLNTFRAYNFYIIKSITRNLIIFQALLKIYF